MKAEYTRMTLKNIAENIGTGFPQEFKELDEIEAKAAQFDDPHIQELIECDRIERKLSEKYEVIIEINKLHISVNLFVGNSTTFVYAITNKTKLEALRKADEWLDGRGANDGR